MNWVEVIHYSVLLLFVVCGAGTRYHLAGSFLWLKRQRCSQIRRLPQFHGEPPVRGDRAGVPGVFPGTGHHIRGRLCPDPAAVHHAGQLQHRGVYQTSPQSHPQRKGSFVWRVPEVLSVPEYTWWLQHRHEDVHIRWPGRLQGGFPAGGVCVHGI